LDLKKNKKIIILACVLALAVIVTIVIVLNNKDNDIQGVMQDTTIGTSTTEATTVAPTIETTVTTPPVTTTEEVTTTEWSYTPSIKKETVMKYNNSTSNCKGWIYIKDSAIDYPIMQSEDNEFYVTHAWNGAASNSGAIMLDYECTIGQTNNILLYGHNMGNGSMFHQVKSYKDKDWWINHQYVEIANLEKIYVYQIFSIDVLYGLSDASFTYWLEPNKTLASEDIYNEFVNNVVSKQYTSVGIKPPTYPTGILTLQTCESAANDGMRCVAFGKLVGVYDLQ